MSRHLTSEQAQFELKKLCNQVVDNREVVIIKTEEDKNVALIAADELSGMEETIYLLSSPANAVRLYAAIEQAKTRTVKPQTIDELFEELHLTE